MQIRRKEDLKLHQDVKNLHSPVWEYHDFIMDQIQFKVFTIREQVRKGEQLQMLLRDNGLTENEYLKILATIEKK
jgi:hypothetical protein